MSRLLGVEDGSGTAHTVHVFKGAGRGLGPDLHSDSSTAAWLETVKPYFTTRRKTVMPFGSRFLSVFLEAQPAERFAFIPFVKKKTTKKPIFPFLPKSSRMSMVSRSGRVAFI